MCCQSGTKETLNHPYRGQTACTASRSKPSTWEESASCHPLVPPLCTLAAQDCLLLSFFSPFLYLAVTSCIALKQQVLWVTGHLSCDCLAPDRLAHQRHCNAQDREAGKAWLSDPSPFSCLAGNEVPSKEHHELKPYVHHLHVIDNQQALFELSHRIEPRV